MEKKNIAIGIDIGGTSFKGAAIDREGHILHTFKMDVNKGDSQEKMMDDLLVALNKFLKEHGYNKDNVLGIGMGVPGAIDTENGVVSYSNNLDWYELPVVKIIKDGTGLPVRITNDANAAAYGEAKFGAGKTFKNLLMITLGTGVGGGIIIDGKLYEGNHGKGAEPGHSVIVLNGEQCTCGRKGCFEAYASATALIRDTKRMMDKHPESKMWDISKELGKVDGRVAFMAAKAGDKYGEEVVNNYVMYLSEGLMNLFNIFRPEAVVLSGGVANEGEYLLSRVDKYCKDRFYGYKSTPSVKLLVSELGYDSGKIGAAALFFEQIGDYV